MNKCIRSLLLVFEIGGGFTGLTVALEILCGKTSTPSGAFPVVMALALAVFSLLGIVGGVTLVEWPRLGLRLSLVFQSLQVIVVFSPYLTYFAYAGLQTGVVWTQGRPRWFAEIGARVGFGLGYPHAWSVGVNLIALALTIYLVRRLLKTKAYW